MGVSCVAGGCVVEGDGAAGLDDGCLGRIGVVSAIAGWGPPVVTAAASFTRITRGGGRPCCDLSTFPSTSQTHLRLLFLGVAQVHATH